MTKKQEKLLKELVSKLPAVRYVTTEKAVISAAEVQLTGLKVPAGMELKEDELYTYKYPFYHNVNHMRRCRRAFEKGGREGLWHYLKNYVLPENRLAVKSEMMKIWA